MEFRDRAYPVGAQELVFVEHFPQHLPQLVLIDYRQEPPLAHPLFLHGGHVLPEVGPVLYEPFHPLPEPLELLEHVGLYGLYGVERYEPHHGAHLQRQVVTVRQVQHVVIELVILVPEAVVAPFGQVYGPRDIEEMLEELGRDVLVAGVVLRELYGYREHVEAVHAHPACAVRLLEYHARRELGVPVEYAYVVEPEEPSLEYVLPLGVLPVDPPGEIEEELLKDPLQEMDVLPSVHLVLNVVNPPGGPGVHGGVDVTERPFVCGYLAVGVHVPFPRQEHQLALSEIRVDEGVIDGVKGEVPRREPGVFPLVGHGEYVLVIDVYPAVVPPQFPRLGGRGAEGVAVEPFLDDVIIKLLGPQHSRESLALYIREVRRERVRAHPFVKLVRLLFPFGEDRVIGLAERVYEINRIREPELDRSRLPGRYRERVMSGYLRPRAFGVDGALPAADYVVVDAVLDVRRFVRRAVDPLEIGFVLREEEPSGVIAVEPPLTELGVRGFDHFQFRFRLRVAERGFFLSLPRPRVPEPERGEQVERRFCRPPVRDRDEDEYVLGRFLGVLDEDVEIAVLVKGACVHELVFGLVPGPLLIDLDQLAVGIGLLRILVEALHVRVGRRVVEVIVIFLHILPVVAFVAR